MLKAKLVIARKAVIYMAKPKIEPNEITASRIKLLRKAVDEINNILSPLEVIK